MLYHMNHAKGIQININSKIIGKTKKNQIVVKKNHWSMIIPLLRGPDLYNLNSVKEKK